jgi:hypothetical protein
MDNSTAYQMGQVAGAIIGILLMLGICVFFVIALVKSFTKRSKGWIIAAAVSGLPFLLFLFLFIAGMVIGFKKAVNHSTELNQARQGEPSQLITAAMSPVSGNSIAYTISLPWMSDWQKNDSHAPFDYLFSYHDAYLGIIAEGIGLGSPERICDVSQKNLASKASQFSVTTPVPVEIDSRSWLTYDATATLREVTIKYRFYVYADSNYTFQIIAWTGPALFTRNAPVFDRIANSFKMPK